MDTAGENLNARESEPLSFDEELPSYQLPRDDSICEERDISPARLPFSMLPSSARATSLPFSDKKDKCYVESHPKTCSAPDILQKSSFKSLGMADKDISWASSMESIVAECTPRDDFNTIEKATFFPDPEACHSKQIQPRALFPRESDESLGLKPLDSCFNLDELPPYSRAMRLSDVCDVLKSLNVVNGKTHSDDLPQNRFDFVDAAPNSPSVFSQKSLSEKDLFEVDKKCVTTSSNCPSPSIFSPDCKQNKGSSPIKKLSPIAEARTLEDSQLEIVLDESIPSGFSTPIKKVPFESQKIEQASKQQSPIKNVVRKKVLYGAAADVQLITVGDDEIVKTLVENEKASSDFLNTKPPEMKTLPLSQGLIPFSQWLKEENFEKKVLKRPAEELVNFKSKRQKTDSPSLSSWNMPDSQAEITDTEMFRAGDFVEKTFEMNAVPDENPAATFMGFKTANDKILKPTIASLAKVNHFFDECLDEVGDKSRVPLETEILSHSSKSEKIFEKKCGDAKVVTCGFRTGNKSVIQPSSASLVRMKNFFDECDVPEMSVKEKINVGFATASNKCLVPSAAALAKSKRIFENLDNENGLIDSKEQFCGFSTANARVIQPSSSSFAKIKNLFEGCEETDNNFHIELKTECEKSFQLPETAQEKDETVKKVKKERKMESSMLNNKQAQLFSGFSTGNKKPIKPSEESLRKVEDLFKVETGNQSKSVMEESYSALLENTDWDDTMLPMWMQSPEKKISNDSVVKPAVKRQSSPSRESTKRAKIQPSLTGPKLIQLKRKAAREAQARIIEEKKGTERSIKGSHFLKKEMARQKTWKEILPDGPRSYDKSQLHDFGVLDKVINLSFDNAKDFRFSAKDYYSSTLCENNTSGLTIGDGFSVILDPENSFGAEEIESAFLAGPGVAPELVPSGWVVHHYGLLVWKIGCYERTCGEKFAASALNPDNIMFQLKYRYDREIDRSQSSALKRVLERDDAAGKALVLTVLRITKLVEGNELLLTDGWYTCPARTDCALSKAISSGKIKVGTKLMTIGAELIGCDQGTPPLERTDGIYLKISTNSTRRVRWYHKLGFQSYRSPPSIPLTSILPGGGNVAHIRVVVVRAYPLVFVEKTADGKNVSRNARAEQKWEIAFQQSLETEMTKLCDQIENDMDAKTSRGFNSISSIAEIQSPEKLYSLLAMAEDPGAIEVLMTEEQKSAVLKYRDARRVQNNRIMEDKMKELNMNKRNVRTVLRVRLADLNDSETSEFSAVLSWWQPDEQLISIFTEGSALSIFNVSPGNGRNHQQLYLNSSRQTRVEVLPTSDIKTAPRSVYRVGDIHPNLLPIWGELDVVGLVVLVQAVTKGSSLMQTVYLTDTGQHFFGLIFWRGLKEFCCEDILAEGLIVGVSNVQWRRSCGNASIPSGFVTETTQFALSSKSSQIQSAITDLKDELEEEDLASLIELSQDAITARLNSVKHQGANLSCASNTSAQGISSIIGEEMDTTLSPRPRYVNGFAQFPRAASTPVKTRCSVHSRLDQLLQTGEPPPLSPITIPNSGKLSRAFKLPTINETLSTDS